MNIFLKEYFDGRAISRGNENFYIGKYSFEKLHNLMKNDVNNLLDCRMIYNCIHKMKFCLYYMKDILKKSYGFNFNYEIKILTNCIEQVEDLCMYFYMNILRKKQLSLNAETYCQSIENIKNSYNELCNCIKNKLEAAK